MQLKFFVEDRGAPGGDPYEVVRNDAAWADEEAQVNPVLMPTIAHGNPIAAIGVLSGTSALPQPVALSHNCLYTRAALVVTSPQWIRGCRLMAQPQEILAYCRARLHPDMRPREVFIIDALPRNANGKPVRRDLVNLLSRRRN